MKSFHPSSQSHHCSGPGSFRRLLPDPPAAKKASQINFPPAGRQAGEGRLSVCQWKSCSSWGRGSLGKVWNLGFNRKFQINKKAKLCMVMVGEGF